MAPVLDRQGMLAGAPFPAFPIRLPLPGAAPPVPALDQHRGEGFAGPADERPSEPVLLRSTDA